MIREGETFIYGRTKEQAQHLLAACRTLGVDPHLVRATDSGFIVPDEVSDEADRATQPRWATDEAVF